VKKYEQVNYGGIDLQQTISNRPAKRLSLWQQRSRQPQRSF